MAGFEELASMAGDVGKQLQTISVPASFCSGVKAGLLTFGGAYKVITFLQRDAVMQVTSMNNAQFLDGLALSGLLLARQLIFSTFVGIWVRGAVAMKAGLLLPAFAFTLLGHDMLERLARRPSAHRLLERVTAGVVGLIAGKTLALMRASLTNIEAWLLFAIALGSCAPPRCGWSSPGWPSPSKSHSVVAICSVPQLLQVAG